MADDYYDDASDKPADDKEEVSSTALLPKSVLMGKDFSVGDEVVLKITGIHGDEVQVEYATGEGEPEKEPEGEPEKTPEEGDPGEMPSPEAQPEMANSTYD